MKTLITKLGFQFVPILFLGIGIAVTFQNCAKDTNSTEASQSSQVGFVPRTSILADKAFAWSIGYSTKYSDTIDLGLRAEEYLVTDGEIHIFTKLAGTSISVPSLAATTDDYLIFLANVDGQVDSTGLTHVPDNNGSLDTVFNVGNTNCQVWASRDDIATDQHIAYDLASNPVLPEGTYVEFYCKKKKGKYVVDLAIFSHAVELRQVFVFQADGPLKGEQATNFTNGPQPMFSWNRP